MKGNFERFRELVRDLFSLDKLRPQVTGRWEFLMMRLLFALALLDEFSVIKLQFPLPTVGAGRAGFTEQPFPVGMAHVVDLTALGDPAIYGVVQSVLVVGLLIYVTGFGLPIVLPVITTIHLMVFTLHNSQGATHHVHQMGSLVLLAQWIVVWWPRGRKMPEFGQPSAGLRDLMVFHSMAMVAGCYVIAGIAKLVNSSGLWLWQSPYMAMSLYKTNEQRFYSYLDPSDRRAEFEAVAAFMFENPMLARVILGGGFFLELLAFWALRGRIWALLFGIGIVAMHEMIDKFMGIDFRQNELLVVVFLINLPFLIGAGLRRITGRDSRSGTEPSGSGA